MKVLPRIAYIKNARIYKVLANPKRLEILNLLKIREFSVEELTKKLKLPKPNISQHLAILRYTNLVKARRNGLRIYYKIIDPRIVAPCRILYSLNKKELYAS